MSNIVAVLLSFYFGIYYNFISRLSLKNICEEQIKAVQRSVDLRSNFVKN